MKKLPTNSMNKKKKIPESNVIYINKENKSQFNNDFERMINMLAVGKVEHPTKHDTELQKPERFS